MHSKISKKDLFMTSIKKHDTGLSYIHCPYPLPILLQRMSLINLLWLL